MCCSDAVHNVAVLSLGFFLLFAAFNTVQSFATTLLGSLGNASLAVLYLTVALTVPFAPGAIKMVGSKPALVFGAVCYALYLGSLITGNATLILIGSVVIGIGSAALWVAFGLITNANAAKSEAFGEFMGFFWSGLQMSNVVGNLAAYFVLSKVQPGVGLFVGFAIAGTAGALVLLALRSVDGEGRRSGAESGSAIGDSGPIAPLLIPDADDLAWPASGKATRSDLASVNRDRSGTSPSGGGSSKAATGSQSVAETGRLAASSLCMVCDPRVRMLGPLFLLTGAELAFWSGSLPLVVREDRVGLLLATVGFADVVGGSLFGWLGDVVGRAAVVAIGCLMIVAGCAGTTALALAGAGASGVVAGATFVDVPLLAWVGGVCFGLGDAALNTQAYAVLGDLFEKDEGAAGNASGKSKRRDDAAMANTVLQLFNNLGSATIFYSGIPLPLVAKAAENGAFHADSIVIACVIAGLAVATLVATCNVRGAARGRGCRRKGSDTVLHGRIDTWSWDETDALSI